MNDVDVLVPFACIQPALRLLEELDFSIPETDPRTFPLYTHALTAVHADGTQVDLHWQLHPWLGLPGAPSAWGTDFWEARLADDEFWGRAVPLQVGTVTCEAPCAEDLLLHVCVHGAYSPGGPPLRWVADAATIVRTRPELQWGDLIAQARRRHVAPRLAEALKYLAGDLDVPVPSHALTELRGSRPSARERVAHWVSAGPPRGPGVRRGLAHWASITLQEPAARAVASLPRYVRLKWGADHAWQVPLEVSRRLVQHVRPAKPDVRPPTGG
jgi:hypothetical protein